jgi:CDP-glucose 4,6-dehydratase
MEIKHGKVISTFWNGKKVFITGHTGFKGSWLSLWLTSMGSKVKGYSLDVNTDPALFNLLNISSEMESEIGDIRNLDKLTKSIMQFDPEIIIHMAAQPLVRLSYLEPIETYTTNVIGTANVLEAARKCKNLKSLVSVTTDKCYENMEWDWGYRESDSMGGYDPYSSSKGCAELVTSAYRRSYFYSNDTASIASARAGNVIGGGDWSEDRLIPDVLRAFEIGEPVVVRSPLAVRPWQHVLEPLSGYLVLSQKLYMFGNDYAEAWNFGPRDEDCKSVRWVLDQMVKHWGKSAKWVLDKNSNPHEARYLKLDCSKASNKLKWNPKWNLKETIKRIVEWHHVYSSKGDIKKQCFKEINEYSNE